MAADIGIDATTSLDEAFAEALGRHGEDAKVVVLPFARYQLPRSSVRMDAEPLRFPQEAHA
jgi:lactate racemase